ncbi:MAG: glycosyltransferase family 4 protein [Nanobdellota archaeon]
MPDIDTQKQVKYKSDNYKSFSNNLEGKKILYLPEFDLDKDMVGRWRHDWPSKYLHEFGLEYKIKGAMEPIIYRPTSEERKANPKRAAVEIASDKGFNRTNNRAQAYMLKKLKKDIDNADVVVFGRTNNLFASDIFDYAKKNGKIVGYEVDDLTFGKDGVFRKTDKPGQKSLGDYIEEQIKKADFITVSTPYLKEEVSKLRNGEENIYHLKNRLDLDSLKDSMPEIKQKKNNIRIGWAGGKYHIDKLLNMKNVFKELKNKYNEDITVVIKGITPANMKTPKEKQEFNKLYDLFHDNSIKCEFHPYTKSGDWREYYKQLGKLDLDIFFAPLIDDPPHHAKSELKYLESAYIGAPIVVPAIGGHKHAINHDFNGLLVSPEGKEHEFIESIDYLIQNPEKRYEIANNARSDIFENYDVRKSSEELVKIFAEQMQKKGILKKEKRKKKRSIHNG